MTSGGKESKPVEPDGLELWSLVIKEFQGVYWAEPPENLLEPTDQRGEARLTTDKKISEPRPSAIEISTIDKSEGSLTFKPATMNLGEVSLLANISLTYTDPKAADVRLKGSWSGPDELLLHQKGESFHANLLLPSGSYSYCFESSGLTYPDPGSRSYQVILGSGGILTPLEVEAPNLRVSLFNASTGILQGHLASIDGVFKTVAKCITVPPGKSEEAILIGTERLVPSIQEDDIQFVSKDGALTENLLHLAWQHHWPGPLPLAIPAELNLRMPTQTIGNVLDIPLTLWVCGEGPLKVLCYCGLNGWFQELNTLINSPGMWEKIILNLSFPLTSLGSVPPSRMTIHIDTGCSLDNLRYFDLSVEVPLIRLIKAPDFLNFLQMAPGERRNRLLQVERSDGEKSVVDLELSQESELCGHLEIKALLPHLWMVKVSAVNLPQGLFWAEYIWLKDRTSGLTDAVPILLSTR